MLGLGRTEAVCYRVCVYMSGGHTLRDRVMCVCFVAIVNCVKSTYRDSSWNKAKACCSFSFICYQVNSLVENCETFRFMFFCCFFVFFLVSGDIWVCV